MIREGAEDARRFDPQVQCKLADARLAAPMHDAKWRAVDYQMKNVHRMLSRAPGWNPSKQCAHLDKHIEIVRECEAYREVEKDALSQANQRWRFLRVNEQIKFGRDFERGTSQDHPLLGSREDSEIMARWKQYRRF